MTTETAYTMHPLGTLDEDLERCPHCCEAGDFDAPLSWLNLYRRGWASTYIACERHQVCWFVSIGRDHGEEAKWRQRDLTPILGMRLTVARYLQPVLGKRGRPEKGNKGSNRTLKDRGTTVAYTLARLRRDRPELAENECPPSFALTPAEIAEGREIVSTMEAEHAAGRPLLDDSLN